MTVVRPNGVRRFVIVGAGIGGLVTALMLGRAGHEGRRV